MKAKVFVTLKDGVLDPQGKAVVHALSRMQYENVNDVRQGKYFEIDLKDSENADEQIKQMCEKLLVNTVIEDYTFEIVKD